MSLSWRLGRAVVRARAKGTIGTVHEDLIHEFGGPESARKIFEGKIVGIGQSLYKGHSYGNLIIEKLKGYENGSGNGGLDNGPEKVSIPFMNENLVVEATYASGEKKVYDWSPSLLKYTPLSVSFVISSPTQLIVAPLCPRLLRQSQT